VPARSDNTRPVRLAATEFLAHAIATVSPFLPLKDTCLAFFAFLFAPLFPRFSQKPVGCEDMIVLTLPSLVPAIQDCPCFVQCHRRLLRHLLNLYVIR
jgi:hypothetical protein